MLNGRLRFDGRNLECVAEIGGSWTRNIVSELQKGIKDRPQNLDVTYRVELLDKYGFDLS